MDSTTHAAPVTLAGQWEAAQKIRKQVWPLKKQSMSNAEATKLGRLEREQFEAWGLPYSHTSSTGAQIEGEHIWHTARTKSGRLCGIWADNEIEAGVKLMVSWGEPMQFVTRDESCELHNAERRKEKDAVKQANAIKRRQERTHDRYHDKTTTPRRLKATMSEGMLF